MADEEQELPLPNKSEEEKIRRWDDITSEVNQITDRLGRPIDLGIRRTVVALRALGFDTANSCEGHTDRGQAFPSVDVRVDRDEAIAKKWQAACDAINEAEANDIAEEELHAMYALASSLSKEHEKPVLKEMNEMRRHLGQFYQHRTVPYENILIVTRGAWGYRIENIGSQTQQINDTEAKAINLEEYKKEMEAFTDFLRDQFFKV